MGKQKQKGGEAIGAFMEGKEGVSGEGEANLLVIFTFETTKLNNALSVASMHCY